MSKYTNKFDFTKLQEELENVKKELDTKNKELLVKTDENNKLRESLARKGKIGSNCSFEGNKYEKDIYDIVSKCQINDTLPKKLFNTQTLKELAGSSSKNDIECSWIKDKDIGIEIKKMKTPDWMQCSIKFTKDKWCASEKGKIPECSRLLFNELINKLKLFNGKIPPFFEKQLTYQEWKAIKDSTVDFDDYYIDIPSDTIKKLYAAKDCKYIQVSTLGLYHLGTDICKFNVPEFICEQQLRVRIKIHNKKTKSGFCNLSVTVACQPKNITDLLPSKYSLDDINKLPTMLTYIK